jgi:hypothetical protein
VSTIQDDKHPNTHRFRGVRREFGQAGALDFGNRRSAPAFEAAVKLSVQQAPFGQARGARPIVRRRRVWRVFAATFGEIR